jgi:MerR family transcriptional regulator, copper efflux regulator
LIPDRTGPSRALAPLPPHPALGHRPHARTADRAARFAALSPLKARPEPATATGRIRSRFDEELRRMNTIAGQITPLGYQITRALLDARISVFFVSHRFGFADRFRREDPAGTLFLRAERGPDGLTFESGRRSTVIDVADLRISELAERTGVPATTLRFYENAGLLPADRAANGYRRYDEDAVARLGFIGAAKRLGLPLEEIAELLTIWADGSCAEVCDDLRPRLTRRIAETEQRAGELAAFTATLYAAREHLDALPDLPGKCGPQCGFLTGEDAEDQAWRSAPVACSLDGPAMSDRISQWHELLHDAEQQSVPDGIRLILPADRAARVAELAVAEQQCCAFLDFRIHLTGQRLYLDIRAPAEAASMLADIFSQNSPR